MSVTRARIEPLSRMRRCLLVLGILISAAMVSIAVGVPGPLRQLERIAYDLLLRGLGEKPPHSAVLVVDIDESSLARYGQWPWPRYLVGDLLNLIRDGQPAAVGVDILFPEADRHSLRLVNQTLQKKFGLEFDLAGLPGELVDHDWALAQVLQRGSFFLGGLFLFEKGRAADVFLPESTMGITRIGRQGDSPVPIPAAHGAVTSIRQLAEAAEGFGFTNVLTDPDGIIRRVPLLISHHDRMYPSLALAVTMAAGKRQQIQVESGAAGAFAIQIGDTRLPVDRHGNLALRFRGPAKTYSFISAENILDGSVPPQVFHQKIVFVGSSAAGLNDTHATPLDRRFPGVEVHATVAGAILDGDAIAIPAWITGVQLFAVIIAALLALMVVLRCSPLVSGVTLLLFFLIVPLGSMFAFSAHRLFISPIQALAVFAATFTLLAVLRFRHEELVVLHRERQLATAQDCAIVGWASLAETRDTETGNHIFRTQKYVRAMAEYLAGQAKAEYRLRPEEIELLCKSAPLHDVGKIGVPDCILLKPGPLSPEEFSEMQQHTVYGARALAKAEAASGIVDETSFLKTAREIALTHHEKWDGSGYPYGIRGKAIPLSGRLMALADVYDALISRRVYKTAMSHNQAAEIILQGRGTHFDPVIVAAFEVLEEQFIAISREYADSEEEHTRAFSNKTT
jgi:adenylate cyclase